MDSDGEMEEILVQAVSQLQPISQDIIRAAPACEALRRCGKPLRGGRADLYDRSYPASRISSFWSHSWHGSKHQKVLTAIWLHNSFPATYISTIGAVVVATLYAVEILPGMDYWETYEYPRSAWGSAVGIVLYCITLFFWQSKETIFLDVLCINQQDAMKKAAGILSMGAFLKCSDSMLVLWDPTYTHRLWCIYEISAYLYSRPPGTSSNLVVRPVLLGPCYMLLTLALTCVTFAVGSIPENDKIFLWVTQALILAVGFYPSVAAYRHYFRALQEMRHELETFTLEGTECMCCNADHVDPSGEQMACDRQVVVRCLTLWFGSRENFEQRVRSEVLDSLMHELTHKFFSYRQCVAAVIPLAWTYIDTASAEAKKYRDFEAYHRNARRFNTEITKELLRGFAWWLCIVPSILLVTLRLGYCLRRKRSSLCGDLCVDSLILFCVVLMFVAAVQLEQACMLVHNAVIPEDSELRGLHTAMLLFALLCLPVAVLLYRCVGAHPRVLAERPAREMTSDDEAAGIAVATTETSAVEAAVAPTAASASSKEELRKRHKAAVVVAAVIDGTEETDKKMPKANAEDSGISERPKRPLEAL